VPAPRYPDPAFCYEGAAVTLAPTWFGPIEVSPARGLGSTYATDPGLAIPAVSVRPYAPVVDQEGPCTTSFRVFYTQYRNDPVKGLAYPMAFRLTSDQEGGVIGVDAALEVDSSYPEIDMSIPRFTFDQPGIGRLKEGKLPRDYEASLTVRVWNGDADIALDGWLMLECGYYRDDDGVDRAGAPELSLVAVGRVRLVGAQPPPPPLDPALDPPLDPSLDPAVGPPG
jgi:hypothetical protein